MRMGFGGCTYSQIRVIHFLLSVICYLLSVICYLLSAICYLLSLTDSAVTGHCLGTQAAFRTESGGYSRNSRASLSARGRTPSLRRTRTFYKQGFRSP